MKIECSIVSDVGVVRHNNEDNFYLNGLFREDISEDHIEYSICYEKKDFLAAVFDGMGGEENGELASLEAARILSKYQKDNFVQIRSSYITEANESVCSKMSEMDNRRMGSTLAIVKIQKGKLSFCNVGDSPIYIFRNNNLQQLSINHNEAQSLFDMGLISKKELRTSKKKNRLTQHLGIFEEEMIIEPYFQEDIPLREDDYILLCSDGLTDMVEEEEIETILMDAGNVHQMADLLVNTALENGGRDNVTLLLLHVIKAK